MGDGVADAEVELDDLQRLMYTSGTTAHPKGAMITYGNFYWKNLTHAIDLQVTGDDRILVVGPLYHAGGFDVLGSTALYLGGTVVVVRSFDALQVLRLVDREHITGLWLAPAMINMILNEPSLEDYNVSSVRIVVDGGEKMPLSLINRFLARFPGTWFCDGYGLTETVSGDVILRKDKTIEKLGSVGRPITHQRVRIVDDQGCDAPVGTLGEIVLKGPKVFKGYWKDSDATEAALRGGWFHTGDVGYLDEDGYLFIVDRKKDMIISGGENIASAEVERVIYELPEVLEVAVVGVPHPKWLEVPKAFVVLRQAHQLTEQQVIDHCTSKLAKFKVPKDVEFIAGLPRNPSGKVLKRELRKHAGD
jgi:acyl-CoA synthetase (AMP-forming)/AMP-acid ligase II